MRSNGSTKARIVACTVLVMGCVEPAAQARQVTVKEADSADVRTVTIDGPIDAVPEWTVADAPLTEIGGDASSLLGQVGAVELLADGQVLIYDEQSRDLRIFTASGQVARLVSHAGDGPGEVEALAQLSLTPGDTIYAFDPELSRISAFSHDGDFLRAIPVRPDFAGPGTRVLRAWALDSDRFLLYGIGRSEGGLFQDPPHRAPQERILQVHSGTDTELGAPIQFIGEYNVRGTRGEVRSPFSNQPFVTVNAGRILYGSGLAYELLVRDFALGPIQVIRWPGQKEPLTAAMVATVRDSMNATSGQLRRVDPAALEWLVQALFQPDVVPETLPAVGAALLDEQGRIWVSRFAPCTDVADLMRGVDGSWHQESAWHVLAPDGSPLARVRLPSNARLLAVRGDRLAVVTRDSLDVQHVRVLQLEEWSDAH